MLKLDSSRSPVHPGSSMAALHTETAVTGAQNPALATAGELHRFPEPPLYADPFHGYCELSGRTSNPHWFLFEDEGEKTQHESALALLLEWFPDHRDLVHRLYVEKLREYTAEATIRAFISIFVIREVKGRLQTKAGAAH